MATGQVAAGKPSAQPGAKPGAQPGAKLVPAVPAGPPPELARRRLRGVTFVVAMLAMMLVGSLWMAVFALPVLMTAAAIERRGPAGRQRAVRLRRWAGWLVSLIVRIWQASGIHILEKLLGFTARVTFALPAGLAAEDRARAATIAAAFAPPPPGKVTVLLLNHRTRLDWMLIWVVLMRHYPAHEALRIALKGEMAKIPLLGFAMQLGRYLFLTRSWTDDKARIATVVRYYKTHEDRPVLLLFPEGTDLSPSNVVKSRAFAAKAGLPQFEQVLNPRTTGTVAFLRAVGPEALHEVLDVTMAYTDFRLGERFNETRLLAGETPKAIHLLVRRFRPGPGAPGAFELPADVVADIGRGSESDDAAASCFLHASFAQREALLRRFYARQAALRPPEAPRHVGEAAAFRASFADPAVAVEPPGESWVDNGDLAAEAGEGAAVHWMCYLGTAHLMLSMPVMSPVLFALTIAVTMAMQARFGGPANWLLWPYA